VFADTELHTSGARKRVKSERPPVIPATATTGHAGRFGSVDRGTVMLNDTTVDPSDVVIVPNDAVIFVVVMLFD